MWSDDDDDLEFAAAAGPYRSEESDHDVDSDMETLLYTQVYHIEVKDDQPRSPPLRAASASASQSKEKANSNSIKPDVSHRLPKVALGDGDSIYDAKLRCSSVAFRSALPVAVSGDGIKVKTRRQVRKADKTRTQVNRSKAEVNDVTPSAGEVVITIKRSEARARLEKSAQKPLSISSDDDDEDDVVQAVDVSGIYTHLSEEVDVEAVDRKKKKKKMESKRKSESVDNQRPTKKRKVMVKDEAIVKTKSIDPVELQAACLKAMVEFYTTMSEAEASGPTPSAKGRASKWAISNADRRGGGARQTKGRFFMKCALCHESGHLVESCPQARKEPRCRLCGENHLMNSCENRLCSVCWQPWHPIRHCPLQPGTEEAQLGCRICKRYGHVSNQCSDHWRKFHSAVEPSSASSEHRALTSDQHELKPFREASCYNCGRHGHFGHECTAWRMDLNLVPFFPFVSCHEHYHGHEHQRRHRDQDGESGSLHHQSHSKKKNFAGKTSRGKDGKWHRKSKSAKHERNGQSKKAKKNKGGPESSEKKFKKKRR